MATEEEIFQFRRIQNSVGTDDSQKLVANMPPYPQDLKERFPTMQNHEDRLREWVKELIIAIRGGTT